MLAYAAANDITFYWTLTDASWLNRIECHFTAMKKFALDNTDYQSHEEQQRAIRNYLKWRNRRRKGDKNVLRGEQPPAGSDSRTNRAQNASMLPPDVCGELTAFMPLTVWDGHDASHRGAATALREQNPKRIGCAEVSFGSGEQTGLNNGC